MTEREAKASPFWPCFVEFAKAYGIELEYHEDWYAWWDCFYAGVKARSELSRDFIEEFKQ
jgi:hypothetical protein